MDNTVVIDSREKWESVFGQGCPQLASFAFDRFEAEIIVGRDSGWPDMEPNIEVRSNAADGSMLERSVKRFAEDAERAVIAKEAAKREKEAVDEGGDS